MVGRGRGRSTASDGTSGGGASRRGGPGIGATGRGTSGDGGRTHWLTAVLGLGVAVAVVSAITPDFWATPDPPARPGRGVAEPPVRSPSVVRRFPHDTEAFTQGLVFDRGTLFESTGQYGRSELRRVELTTGAVKQRRKLSDRDFGEGLAVHGGRLIQLTWREGAGYVYDRESFGVVRRFGYKTEGWGITTNGRELIMSDGSATLSFLDPVTFAIRRRLTVTAGGRPVDNLNELEYVRGALYANVWPTARAVRIDPATGRVNLWWDLTALGKGADGVANGIAYDATTGRMYVTGKNWPALYEVRLPG
jgi:glutaminyl-peptide cyclotransferase